MLNTTITGHFYIAFAVFYYVFACFYMTTINTVIDCGAKYLLKLPKYDDNQHKKSALLSEPIFNVVLHANSIYYSIVIPALA